MMPFLMFMSVLQKRKFNFLKTWFLVNLSCFNVWIMATLQLGWIGLRIVMMFFFFFWCRDRSVCGHSVTTGETLAVCSVQVGGANAYQVSGSFTHLVMNKI